MKNKLVLIIDDALLAASVVKAFPDWNCAHLPTHENLQTVVEAHKPDLIVSEFVPYSTEDFQSFQWLVQYAAQRPETVVLNWTNLNLHEVAHYTRGSGIVHASISAGAQHLRTLYHEARNDRAKLSKSGSESNWINQLIGGGAILAALALRVSKRTKEVLWDLEALMELTPLEFERVIKERFEAEGYTAQLTKQSHDDGVDIIVTRDQPPEGLVVLLVQCKLYTERKSVPSKDIRELRGTVAMEKGTKGILVSTVPLSVPALKKMRANAERLGAITGPDLIAWLNNRLKEAPPPAKS